jgi:hypothetical protein
MSRAVGVLVYALANIIIAAPFALLGVLMLWAFLQPDPVQQAKGREAHADLSERLQVDEERCVDEFLEPMRATRGATDTELADAHRWCDRLN